LVSYFDVSNGHIHYIHSLDDSTRQIYEVILDCNSLPSETDQLVTTPPDVITTERSLATMSHATTAAFIPLILLTLAIS